MGPKAKKQLESQSKNSPAGGRISTPLTNLKPRNDRFEFSDNEFISEDDQEDEEIQDNNENSKQETNLPSTSRVVPRGSLGKQEVRQDPARIRPRDRKEVTVDDVTSPRQKSQEKVKPQTLIQQIFTPVFMYQLMIILVCVALTNSILIFYLIRNIHVSDTRQTHQTSYRSNERDNSINIDLKVKKAVNDKFYEVDIGKKVQEEIGNKLVNADIDSKVKSAIDDKVRNALNNVDVIVSQKAESVLKSQEMTSLIDTQVSKQSSGIKSDIETTLSSKIAKSLGESLDKKVEAMEEAFSGIAEMRNALKEKRTEFEANYALMNTGFSELSNKYTEVSDKAKIDSGKIEKLQKTLEEGENALTNLKDNLTALEQTLLKNERLYEEYKSKVEKLDDIRSKLDVIQPNIFNKDSFIMAFMILLIIVFALALAVYNLYQRQNNGVLAGTGGQTRAKQYGNSMDRHEVLRKIPERPGDLRQGVCIISFDEGRTETHRRILDSANIPNCKVEIYVVRRHEQIPDIPRYTVYLMCTEFSERHVIIEEPGLGLGDLHRTTHDAVLRLGGCLIILYTRDPGSRHLNGQSLYNNKIYCVTNQPELSDLEQDGRFFSVYDSLTSHQKKELGNKILENMSKDREMF